MEKEFDGKAEEEEVTPWEAMLSFIGLIREVASNQVSRGDRVQPIAFLILREGIATAVMKYKNPQEMVRAFEELQTACQEMQPEFVVFMTEAFGLRIPHKNKEQLTDEEISILPGVSRVIMFVGKLKNGLLFMAEGEILDPTSNPHLEELRIVDPEQHIKLDIIKNWNIPTTTLQ